MLTQLAYPAFLWDSNGVRKEVYGPWHQIAGNVFRPGPTALFVLDYGPKYKMRRFAAFWSKPGQITPPVCVYAPKLEEAQARIDEVAKHDGVCLMASPLAPCP